MTSAAVRPSLRCLVGQHRLPDYVPYGIDVVDSGPLSLVHRNEAPLVDGEASHLRRDAIGIRAAPDRDQNPVEAVAVGAFGPSKATASPSSSGVTPTTRVPR